MSLTQIMFDGRDAHYHVHLAAASHTEIGPRLLNDFFVLEGVAASLMDPFSSAGNTNSTNGQHLRR